MLGGCVGLWVPSRRVGILRHQVQLTQTEDRSLSSQIPSQLPDCFILCTTAHDFYIPYILYVTKGPVSRLQFSFKEPGCQLYLFLFSSLSVKGNYQHFAFPKSCCKAHALNGVGQLSPVVVGKESERNNRFLKAHFLLWVCLFLLNTEDHSATH